MLKVYSPEIHRARLALPLIRQILSGLSEEDLAAFAREAAGPFEVPRLMVAEAPSGVIRGAFFYCLEDRLESKPTLVIRHLAVSPLGQRMVLDAFYKAIEALAREWKCDCTRFEIGDEDPEVSEYFERRGCHVLKIAGS